MSGTNFSEITWTFLDVETTGLDPSLGERICEVSILRCRNGEVLEKFQSLIDPRKTISPEAQAVNGITPEMLQGKPSFSETAPKILSMIQDSVIVCHNAPFDIGFLKTEFGRLGQSLPPLTVVDTLKLARKHFRYAKNSLGYLARELGVPSEGWHRAENDTMILKNVFDLFMKELSRRGPLELEELVSENV